MIALVLSVYGVVGDEKVQGIGWAQGLIVIAIALVTFILVDLVKVFTIRMWNRSHPTSVIVKPKPTLKSLTQGKSLSTGSGKPTRAQKFNQEHNLNWDEHRAY